MDNSEKFIDIDTVIASKSKKLAKALPKFLISYLKKIIHQDELNTLINRNSHLYDFDFLDAIVKDFGVNIVLHGTENIPSEGRFIFASNHPLGGMDGIALMHASGKIGKHVCFPVNDILMHLDNLTNLFIPVNKHGVNTTLKERFDNAFKSNSTILYFPAGLVSRKKKEIIKDLDWKKTFVTMAKKYERDIIPVFIDGRNSNFFYNLANFRKRIGLKANLEMLYLVDEMFKQNNKTINIIFGKPISYLTFDKSKRDSEWAMQIREYVYKLNENHNLEFNK